jgi:hypothetical protein
MGVLRSTVKGLTIDQAADREYKEQNKPADWVRTPSRFGNARALKIIGTNSKDSTKKMVEYYVESSDGYYLVQCLAPQDQWAAYSPLFTVMIKSFQFGS